MGTEGLEPSRTITRQRILSPSCLPIPLGIEDLQSTALPLGHAANCNCLMSIIIHKIIKEK